jgi:hypothetical protein
MFNIVSYAHPERVYLFFGIFVLLAIFLGSYHVGKRRASRFAAQKSWCNLAQPVLLVRQITKKILLALTYLLLVFALIQPLGKPDFLTDESGEQQPKTLQGSLSKQDKQEKEQTVRVRENARDIIFLLDVSASMGAEDLYPNRLAKAKEIINDVIATLDGEHIGLVVFTSIPSVKCVLTLDYTYFRQILDKVEINDNDFAGTKFMPALTEIIDKQFDFSTNKYKELIIITDGGDTDLAGLPVADRQTAAAAIYDLSQTAYDDKGIRIHTIGLGTPAGAIIRGVVDKNGQPVKAGIDADFLQQISKRAKGVNIIAADGFVDIGKVYRRQIAVDRDEQIAGAMKIKQNALKELLQKETDEGEQKITYKELYILPLFLALCLLVIEFFIPIGRYRKKTSYK